MRQAIFAALVTFLAAIGLAGGSLALVEESISPETSGAPLAIKRQPQIPEPSIPLPAPPTVTADNTEAEMELMRETRHESEPVSFAQSEQLEATETASEAAPEPEPEPEPEVTPEPEQPVEQPANTGMGDGVEQWRGLVTAYFGVELADTALCLMQHESGGNPNAQNSSSGASGLMQVLPSWAGKFGYAESDLFIPDVNLTISKALYDDGGWGHWSPWNNGACH